MSLKEVEQSLLFKEETKLTSLIELPLEKCSTKEQNNLADSDHANEESNDTKPIYENGNSSDNSLHENDSESSSNLKNESIVKDVCDELPLDKLTIHEHDKENFSSDEDNGAVSTLESEFEEKVIVKRGPILPNHRPIRHSPWDGGNKRSHPSHVLYQQMNNIYDNGLNCNIQQPNGFPTYNNGSITNLYGFQPSPAYSSIHDYMPETPPKSVSPPSNADQDDFGDIKSPVCQNPEDINDVISIIKEQCNESLFEEIYHQEKDDCYVDPHELDCYVSPRFKLEVDRDRQQKDALVAEAKSRMLSACNRDFIAKIESKLKKTDAKKLCEVDKDGDSWLHIVCSHNKEFSTEKVYCLQESFKKIKICCDEPVRSWCSVCHEENSKVSVCCGQPVRSTCVICSNRNEENFYTFLSIKNKQGMLPISCAAYVGKSDIICDYLLSGILENDADVRRLLQYDDICGIFSNRCDSKLFDFLEKRRKNAFYETNQQENVLFF